MNFNINENIKVDINNVQDKIYASLQQGESNVRVFYVEFTSKGIPYQIPTGATAELVLVKPDGKPITQSCVVEDNKVKFTFTEQMATADGIAFAQLYLFDADSESSDDLGVLASTQIKFRVNSGLTTHSNVISSSEFQSLIQALARVNKAIENTLTSIHMINQSNEDMIASEAARVITESKRVEAENLRVTAENTRDGNEKTRKANETTRQTQESTRQTQEKTRQDNETARKNSETERNNSESIRIAQEKSRVEEEKKRVTTEGLRNQAESKRDSEEKIRIDNENKRKAAETVRVTAEDGRKAEEITRDTAEKARVTSEDGRNTNENKRKQDESTRLTNEIQRQTNEASRANVEKTRVTAETLRVTNEDSRKSNESGRIINEDKRTVTETSRVASEQTRETQELERVEAEKLRATATATAITNAETATNKALSSATVAEEAKDSANAATESAKSSTKKMELLYETIKDVDVGKLGNQILEVKDELHNMQIGGRNLILNSTGNSNNDHWGNTIAKLSVGKNEVTGQNSLLIDSRDNLESRGNINQTITNMLELDNLGSYTLSFWYKASPENVLSQVGGFLRLANSSSNNNDVFYTVGKLVLDNKWHFIKVTSDLSPFNNTGVSSAKLYFLAFKGIVEYSCIKLEKGTQATDYTESPNDIDQKIEDVKSAIIIPRNYSIGTNKHITYSNFTGILNNSFPTYTTLIDKSWKVGDKITFSCSIDYSNFVSLTTTKWFIQGKGNKTGFGDGQYMCLLELPKNSNGTINYKKSIVLNSTQLENDYWEGIFRADYFTGASITLRDFMVTHEDSNWLPAPEDIDNKIDELSIGGKNYLENTSNPSELYPWGSEITSEKWNHAAQIYYDVDKQQNVFWTSSAKDKVVLSSSQIMKILPNTTYTFSGWFRGTSNFLKLHIYFLSRTKTSTETYDFFQIKNGIVLPPNEWTYITWTFKTNKLADNGFIRFDNNGSTDENLATLDFIEMKLEKGNKATDHTESAEDIRSDFDKIIISGTNLLNGTNTSVKANDYIPDSGLWSTSSWRQGSSTFGALEKIVISNCPNNQVNFGWRISCTKKTLNVCQDMVPIQNGITYTLSCYARSVNEESILQLKYGRSSYDAKELKISNKDWKLYSFTFTPVSEKNNRTNIYIGTKKDGDIEICGENLKVGSNVSDWSLSSDDINNSQTSGTNLLYNSSLHKNLTEWWATTTVPTFVVHDEKSCAKFEHKAFNSIKQINQRIETRLEPNACYTISGWVKTENIVRGTTNFAIMYYVDGRYTKEDGKSEWYSYLSGNFSINEGNGEWNYLSYTFKTDEKLCSTNSCNFSIFTRDFIGDVYFCELKIEKGNYASSWSPAPEDYLLKADNAVSATKLQTPRKINGVNFDGSTDINIQQRAQLLIDGIDLNSVTTEGVYYCPFNNSAGTISNIPDKTNPQAFNLIVNRHANTNQVLTEYSNDKNFRIFARNLYMNVWSEWLQIYHSGNTPFATLTQNGFMSKEDKKTLDEVPNTYLPIVGGTVNGDLKLSNGYWVHNSSAGGGTAGYLKISQIVVSKANTNSPIQISVIRREAARKTDLSIRFTNETTDDPTVSRFTYTGSGADSSFYIHKSSASTFDVYAQKTEIYDNIGILDIDIPPYMRNRLSISWCNEIVSTLPTGGTYATYFSGEPVSTTSKDGLMSYSDKTKLNNIATGANKTELANNLTTSATGKALDAVQGKVLNDEITSMKDELSIRDPIVEIYEGMQSAPFVTFDSTDVHMLEFFLTCTNKENISSTFIEINTTTGKSDAEFQFGGTGRINLRLIRNVGEWQCELSVISSASGSVTKIFNFENEEITSIRVHTGGQTNKFNNAKIILKKYY